MAQKEAQEVPQDLAAWIADVVQIQALAGQKPVSNSAADRIKESATRLLNILEGRMTPDLQKRMIEAARRMAEKD